MRYHPLLPGYARARDTSGPSLMNGARFESELWSDFPMICIDRFGPN